MERGKCLGVGRGVGNGGGESAYGIKEGGFFGIVRWLVWRFRWMRSVKM
ncbi:hypothetical protein [Bartonella grahamii]|nr:hypothetical protein [Bartonella grahamii]